MNTKLRTYLASSSSASSLIMWSFEKTGMATNCTSSDFKRAYSKFEVRLIISFKLTVRIFKLAIESVSLLTKM